MPKKDVILELRWHGVPDGWETTRLEHLLRAIELGELINFLEGRYALTSLPAIRYDGVTKETRSVISG